MPASVKTLEDVGASVARQIWYWKRAESLGIPREPNGKPQLLVDVSLIAKQDARTGIQRVVRGIWAVLLKRTAEFDLVPVVATRRHGYTAVSYSHDGSFGTPGKDARQVATRKGDIFLGLDLSAHLLPIHSRQLAHWKRMGLTIAIVCYDLLPQTHPQFFTTRTHAHFARWIDWVLETADTIFCISDDVAAQISARIAGIPRTVPPSIRKLSLGGNLLASVPSFGIRPSDAALLERIDQEPAMLMVGTLEPRKAYSAALRAFDRLWADGDACHLVIVGKVGWKSRALIDKLHDHPLRGTLLHWMQDASDEFLDRLYQACSGLLVTSHAEGYCLPVVEAAKHGLPILARDIPVLREHIYADQQFFHDESVEELASAIRSFLADIDRERPSRNVPSWDECGEALLRDLGHSRANVGQSEPHENESHFAMRTEAPAMEFDVAINANGEEKNPYFRAGSLNELLDWYDADFVRCAYVTLLGRQPDPEGEDHYVRTLRAGRSRLAILWELRRSREGRQHDPGIAGLDKALRQAGWQRQAGIGWLLRLLSGSIEGDSTRDRQFRALMNTAVVNRIELQQLAQSMTPSPVASAVPGPNHDCGPESVASHARPDLEKTVAPELQALKAASPLQQYFMTGAA